MIDFSLLNFLGDLHFNLFVYYFKVWSRMPSLRSQQKLDFPVRKESVRRKTKTSRLAAENEDPIAEVIPPRKRGTQFGKLFCESILGPT